MASKIIFDILIRFSDPQRKVREYIGIATTYYRILSFFSPENVYRTVQAFRILINNFPVANRRTPGLLYFALFPPAIILSERYFWPRQ